MNFSGKERHPNIEPSIRPGMEPRTSGLEVDGSNHCANGTPPLYVNDML